MGNNGYGINTTHMNEQERQQLNYAAAMLKNEGYWKTENERMMAQVICVLIGIVQAQDARLLDIERLNPFKRCTL